MENLVLIVAVVLAILFAIGLYRRYKRTKITIYPYQKGLKYRDGKFLGVLAEGKYKFFNRNEFIQIVDATANYITIPTQQVLTSDSISVKITLSAKYQISDFDKAYNEVRNIYDALYSEIQNALRVLIVNFNLDDLLSQKATLQADINSLAKEKAADLGIDLKEVVVKDLMLPSEIKFALSQVIQNQKEALALMEKTRAETAAIRSWANVAKLMEQNPNLLKLKMLETIKEVPELKVLMNVDETKIG